MVGEIPSMGGKTMWGDALWKASDQALSTTQGTILSNFPAPRQLQWEWELFPYNYPHGGDPPHPRMQCTSKSHRQGCIKIA